MGRFRNSLLLIAGLAAFIPINPSVAKTGAPTYSLKTTSSFRDYTVRIYSETDGFDHLEILKSGRIVHEMTGYHLYIGYIYGDEEFAKFHKTVSAKLIVMGGDITGRGVPNLVVSEFSGGAHCCLNFHIFEIGEECREIAVLDAAHGDLAHFEKRSGEKGLVFVANDWAFAYWNASFAESPAPEVILRFSDGRYRLAVDLMRRPAPSDETVEEQIRQVHVDRAWEEGGRPVRLWKFMLDLIYTGNATAAREFFEKAWVPGVPGKTEFLAEFRSQLAKSKYWEDLDSLVGDARVWGTANETK